MYDEVGGMMEVVDDATVRDRVFGDFRVRGETPVELLTPSPQEGLLP
jgi:hypothetical protein